MRYYILAVSKNRAQLFEVSHGRVHPHSVEGMPVSMNDAWKGMERDDANVTSHSSGSGNAMFHGQGGAKDVEEEEEDQYMHALAKSVHTLLHGNSQPLVFAGLPEAYGMFKKFDHSGALLDEYIHGNPDQTTQEELMAKADPIVAAHIMKRNQALIEEYGALLGTGRTSTDVEVIASAAEQGKVDLLLISQGHEREVSDAMAHTVAHRGRVALVEGGTLPEGATVAAIVRY